MTGAQIDDGDLVIIRQQHSAQVGEIVVALTDEDKNTLKRLLYDDDRRAITSTRRTKTWRISMCPGFGYRA